MQEELRLLAESIDLRAQHPATLHLLARTKKAPHSVFGESDLREAQSVYPGDFWLNFELGHALHEQKHREEAIRFYTAAVALRPNSAAARNNLGNVFLDQKNVVEAIAYYHKAIELDPKMAPAHNNLGNAFHVQKKMEEAIACYKTAIEVSPTYAVPHLNLGLRLADDLKDYSNAISCFRRALEIDSNYVDAYTALGNALRDQNKLDEAIRHYRKAIELGPKHFHAYSYLGTVLRHQKKWDEADRLVQQVHRNRPESPKATTISASRCASKGSWTRLLMPIGGLSPSTRTLATPTSASPSPCAASRSGPRPSRPTERPSPSSRRTPRAHSDLGSLLAGEKWDDAIASYRTAIELDSICFLAHTGIGDVLVAQNKRAAAVLSYRRAWKSSRPPPPPIANSTPPKSMDLRRCPLRPRLRPPITGKVTEAINAYRRAIELDPHCEPAWQYLGWVQYRFGKWRASIETLEKSCKIQQGGTGDAGQWIVLALAHARLAAQETLLQTERVHHEAEARRRYEQADKQIDSWSRARPRTR